MSFFKKIRFQNLFPEKYLVKIYRENPFFKKESEYIGFLIVDLNQDMEKHVVCSAEGSLEITLVDQTNKGVENAKVQLLSNDYIIYEELTDENGFVEINAPVSSFEDYFLKIIYKGNNINNEIIKMDFIRSFFPLKKILRINLFDVHLKFTDKWGLIPNFEINPLINAVKSEENYFFDSIKKSDGEYLFADLYPGNYQISAEYKSFILEKEIEVTSNEIFSLTFPVEFSIRTNVYDLRGGKVNDLEIFIERGEKKEIFSSGDGSSSFLLPPGSYKITVLKDKTMICTRTVNIIEEMKIDLVSSNEPIYPFMIMILSIFSFLFFSIFFFKRKDFISILKIFTIFLVILSVIFPWWNLQGSSIKENFETSTSLYLIPAIQVKMINSPDVLSGEITYLPVLAASIMMFVFILLICGYWSIIVNIFSGIYKWKKIKFLTKLVSLLSFTTAILVFYILVSTIAKIGVGGFIGSGSLEISIPGEKAVEIVNAFWGPGIGLYLSLIAIIFMVFCLLYELKKGKLSKKLNIKS